MSCSYCWYLAWVDVRGISGVLFYVYYLIRIFLVWFLKTIHVNFILCSICCDDNTEDLNCIHPIGNPCTSQWVSNAQFVPLQTPWTSSGVLNLVSLFILSFFTPPPPPPFTALLCVEGLCKYIICTTLWNSSSQLITTHRLSLISSWGDPVQLTRC